jgi:formylglycine-generating enzyme
MIGRLWFVIPLLFLSGCFLPVAQQPEAASDQPSVTTMADPLKIIKPDKSQAELKKGDSASVALNDVISAENNGRGLLHFGDKILIDVYRGSQTTILDVKTQPSDTLFVKVEQVNGHVRVRVSENSNAQVRMVTTIATITTLKPGSDFVLCQNPVALTCIVALKGKIEVVGQGKVVNLNGGEGTYILKGKPPFDPICADLNAVNEWIDNKLGDGDIVPLSKLVGGWNPQPCSAPKTPSTQQSQPLPLSGGMVKIPSGTYTIGVATPNDYQVAKQSIALPEFWIDQFEVTNAQYQKFIDDTHHAPPVVWPGNGTLPVSGVTWDDSVAFCAWLHKQIPTEAQWEVAARGPGENPPLYPWGDDPQANGKINDLPLNQIYQGGTYSINKSPFDVYDMAGNVWEWVRQPYAPIPDTDKILRGGRYGFIKDMAYRQQAEANSPSFLPFTGFRCAADTVQGP